MNQSNVLAKPLRLRDHTEVNVARLVTFIQTEESIGYLHRRNYWVPFVGIGTSIGEPIRYISRLLRRGYEKADHLWILMLTHHKALSLLALIEPYLMADKWETARYLLNISKVTSGIEYRPMYHGVVERAIKPVFLYPEYVDFPIAYDLVVHKEDVLLNLYDVFFLSNIHLIEDQYDEGMVREN
ncbi:MAG: hypothetical protein ACUVTD_04935 [Nitrososphaerales archaeon]